MSESSRTWFVLVVVVVVTVVFVYFVLQPVPVGQITFDPCFASFLYGTPTVNDTGNTSEPSTSPYTILSLPSNQLILRSVYFDPRPRDGHRNSSVFMVELHRNLPHKNILACGAGGAVSYTLSVRLAKNLWWIHKNFPQIDHDQAMIDCFGLPETATGTRAFLWFQIKEDGNIYRVESEYPYFVPVPKKDTGDPDDITTVACLATVRSFPPFLKDFLRYYKYVGVDHVYMITHDSFIQTGALENDEFVYQAVKEGFLSYSMWHTWFTDDDIFYHSQLLGHEDCVYRFQGTYDYALMVDSDDHFIPLVPGQMTLDYYIKKYCTVGACTFQWIEYYPDCGMDWTKLGPHGNVTNTLLSKTSYRYSRKTRKPLYMIAATLDVGTHSPQVLMKGYKTKLVPSDAGYVAHIRRNKHPPKGRKC